MFVSLLQPSFFMSLISRSYAQILGFWWFLTAMAIYLSLWVAPSDFQQGENYRMIYVHVPAAWMSLLVHIAVAISSSPFLLTKHPLLPRFSGTGSGIGAFPTLLTLVTGGFRGKPMRGTFRVWDARPTPVFISSFIYPGALCFQKLSVELASISICIGLINTPIIKSPVNWWNTPHQPGSISQFGTSTHVSMPIPILFNSANSPFSTCILLVLETRLLILSLLESSFITEARFSPNEGISASSMMPPDNL
uniref:Cytochrome c biogenesis C n=1 Tax=Taxus cuspidata TaxID=99806 RepID=A0A6M4RKH1_TAXCU|nr:cytochrome c biogenesis C [Taxus cuspidata]